MKDHDGTILTRLTTELPGILRTYPGYKRVSEIVGAHFPQLSIPMDFIALCNNEAVINSVLCAVDLSKTGLVWTGGTRSLQSGFTDIFTYGAGPCSVYIVDGDSLSHQPFVFDLFSAPKLAKFMLTNFGIQPQSSLIFIPGSEWNAGHSNEVSHNKLPELLPGIKITSFEPGEYAIWIGIRSGQTHYVIYDFLEDRLSTSIS